MRSKNDKPHTPAESAHLAAVKSVPCVFCNAPPPVEAHHPWQGLHFLTVAACKRCHDAHAWRIGRPNEQEAINETLRRVNGESRNAGASRQHSARRPSKIIPRDVAEMSAA